MTNTNHPPEGARMPDGLHARLHDPGPRGESFRRAYARILDAVDGDEPLAIEMMTVDCSDPPTLHELRLLGAKLVAVKREEEDDA
ncbi:MAG: hypothetical protein ACT4PV_14800 [Planctomycetaceae bacterium]